MTTRNTTIDILRGIAVLFMILIHTNAYYLSNSHAYELWNWSQFAVPAFVFCSSYIYFKRSKEKHPHITNTFTYALKRISRLLIPYYIYLLFFLIFQLIFSPKNLHWYSLLQQFTLTTPSNDLSWLVVLFMYFILLMPVVDYLARKKFSLFLVVCVLSYLASLYLLFLPSPVHFKLIMWLPWLMIVYYGWFTANYEDKPNFFHTTISYTTLLFLLVLGYKGLTHQQISFYANKYPPNLYYMSYGLASIALIYRFFQRVTLPEVVNKILFFLSKYSYPIFFSHFLILFILVEFKLHKQMHWFFLFLSVLTATLILQYLYVKSKSYFRSTL